MKERVTRFVVSILAVVLLLSCLSVPTWAEANEGRTVRVAFFPMEGYHEKDADGNYGGVEVEYLNVVSEYTGWNVTYVECDSWSEALHLLREHEVDLVGTAQYSEERAEEFLYAEMASGYTFGAIATTAQSNVAYEDFAVMGQMTYGIVKDYVRKNEFYEYMQENKVKSLKVKEYDTAQELRDALENGEIDAMVHTFMEVMEGNRLIGRFAARPTYYITYKGNEEVLKELNAALVDIKLNYPDLETDLMYKFYESRWDNSVLFTTDEKLYILSEPQLVVGYLEGYYPFSYKEKGQFSGLARNMLEEHVSDLKFTYKAFKDRASAIKALENKEIDILAYVNNTLSVSQSDQVQLLKEYVNIPYVLVTKKNTNPDDIRVVVTLEEFSYEAAQALQGKNITLIYEDEPAESLRQVALGNADAAFGGGYMSEYLISTNVDYNELSITKVYDTGFGIYMAVHADAPEELKGILSKTVYMLDEKVIKRYMLEENEFSLTTINNFVKKYSMQIVIGLVCIILFVVAFAVFMIRDFRRIKRLLFKDANMDVWNLHYLIRKGQKLISMERRKKHVIICTNVLKMRQYLVVYGRHAGDIILHAMRKTLQRNVEDSKDICARISADRFALLLEYEDWDALLERLERIRVQTEKAIHETTGNALNVQMGVYPIDHSVKDLHTMVDMAMQALEDKEGNSTKDIRIYDKGFKERITERHEREKMLSTLDVESNFIAYYQCKVDIRTEEVVGAEALVRMLNPKNNTVIAPWYFVPYYEQTGRIAELDFHVLRCACRMLRRRMDEGLKVVPISCNFSRTNFVEEDFVDRFEAVLKEYHISKDLIEVEITETLVVDQMQFQTIKQNLDEMQRRGIRLSIDDFGAGYSSLGIFEHIPASVIKLDRSFMLNHEHYERQVKIMRGIVRLAEELEAEIVCEGVETEEDVALMKEIGAHVAQGYYYSKPIPEEDFEKKIK